MRREWRCLRNSPPGKRFQRRYRRTRDRRSRDHEGSDNGAPRVLKIVAASILLAVGVCLVLFPMIYIPFFVASAAIFASESLSFARLLDWIEFNGRAAWSEVRRWIGISPRSARVIAVVLGLGCLVLTSCVCYNSFMH